jgi:type II secretory pathway component PulF
MTLCVGVIIFVLTFVFPKFASLFADMWEILPLPTKILMTTSTMVTAYWHVLLIAMLMMVIVSWYILQLKKVKTCIDRFAIKAPLLGSVMVTVYTSQSLRILGSLIQGSVPLLEALTITRATIKNIFYQRFIENIIESAKEGRGIFYAFSQTDFMPETVKQVIKTGEESGRLDFAMLKLADYYDGEIEKQFKTLSTVIEPVALIIMGVIVGFIVMSIVLPIFKLSRAIK